MNKAFEAPFDLRLQRRWPGALQYESAPIGEVVICSATAMRPWALNHGSRCTLQKGLAPRRKLMIRFVRSAVLPLVRRPSPREPRPDQGKARVGRVGRAGPGA